MAEMTIKKRPKFLDLTKIHLPLPGKISILHRISGVGLFLFLPVILWLFAASVGSPESFALFKSVASHWIVKVVLAGLIWAFIYHFCAGIRFLLLDFHVGIEKLAARKSAALVLVVSIPLTLAAWGVLL